MSQSKIRAILENLISQWAEDNDLPVAWEDIVFTPPADAPWVRCTLMPAVTTTADLAGQVETYTGLCQVSINVPAGRGPAVAEELLERLKSFFWDGAFLQGGGIDLFITAPVSAGPYQQDPVNSMLPASFRYRADVLRA